MKPVQLSRPLALEEVLRVPDSSGGYIEVWTPLGTLWAEVVAGTGREVAGEEVTVSSVSYRITVRGAPQGAQSRPRVDQRLRDGARVYRILAVSERDAGGHYLTCFAREEVPA